MSCLRLVAQAGFQVYAACPIDSSPTRTRHYRPCPTVNGRIWRGELGEEGRKFLEAMPFDQCVLIPAADDAAVWIAELSPELRNRYRSSSSTAETLHALQDKSSFANLTSTLGIPAPMSYRVESDEDIFRIAFDNIDALFLKPVDSQAFVTKYNRKAIWVQDQTQAIEEWRRVAADGLEMIAQEYVSGGADEHYFIDGFRDREGLVRAKTARRRHRIYPADFGNSSYCRSIEFGEVAAAWAGLETLLAETNYRGIFSAEFKKDSRSGDFKILEVNTRPWVYVEFAGVCGMNMCELYIRDALSQNVPTVESYIVDKGCVNLYDDLIAVIEMPSNERPKIAGVLWAWVRSSKLLFSWRDPWPATYFLARKIGTHVRKFLRR